MKIQNNLLYFEDNTPINVNCIIKFYKDESNSGVKNENNYIYFQLIESSEYWNFQKDKEKRNIIYDLILQLYGNDLNKYIKKE